VDIDRKLTELYKTVVQFSVEKIWYMPKNALYAWEKSIIGPWLVSMSPRRSWIAMRALKKFMRKRNRTMLSIPANEPKTLI